VGGRSEGHGRREVEGGGRSKRRGKESEKTTRGEEMEKLERRG